MQDSGSKSNSGTSNDHEYYSELCALATSGTLTDPEWSQLKTHLAQCDECKAAVQEYREIARTGMALLMPDRPPDGSEDPAQAWSTESAKQELFGRIARGEAFPDAHPRAGLGMHRARVRVWWPVFRPVSQPVLGYAAAVILVITALVSAYRMGAASRPVESGTQVMNTSANRMTAQLKQLTDERAALDASSAARSRELQDAKDQLRRQIADVEKWKALDANLIAELAQRKARFDELQGKYTAVSADRDVISRKLQDSEVTLKAVEQKYDGLRTQQLTASLRTASLEARISELSGRLKDAEATVRQQQEFLVSDRDIRELMGARSLYIADVYDVDRKGETNKPYGRVFYTSGKSLIFYAFDLDRQAHLRNASNFQLWGRRGAADNRPVNMGIFYLDSETNRRWVLKFDDPTALAQIDAVFVTVEPNGGSEKPRGRQLLFASLRNVASNHP